MCKECQTDLYLFNIQKFSIHDGPGIRTTVFFKGCPLRCKWCSNPESQLSEVQPEREAVLAGRLYPLEKVVGLCLEDRDFYLESGGGVTLSGGEVLAQPQGAAALLERLRAEGIHTALETSGFALEETFRHVARQADLLLYDCKHHDNALHRAGTGVGNGRILANLRAAMAMGKEVLVRIPVIPGYNDSEQDTRRFTETLLACGVHQVQLLPFHQFGQQKYEKLGMRYELGAAKTLHPEDLAEMADAMRRAGLAVLL